MVWLTIVLILIAVTVFAFELRSKDREIARKRISSLESQLNALIKPFPNLDWLDALDLIDKCIPGLNRYSEGESAHTSLCTLARNESVKVWGIAGDTESICPDDNAPEPIPLKFFVDCDFAPYEEGFALQTNLMTTVRATEEFSELYWLPKVNKTQLELALQNMSS